MHTAWFRFYAELNDFLPAERHKTAFPYTFRGRPAVKDAIEALGVPHPEVDLILVNGTSVGWGCPLYEGDRVAVYPVFESLDISPLLRLREKPLRRTAFVLDVHLGKLARLLRMLGLDVRYRRDYRDDEIVETACREQRIVLTRDRGLLKRSAVTHGYWVRSTVPLDQAREVVRRFDLGAQVCPFTRCMRCNGLLEPVDRDAVVDRLPPRVAARERSFHRCPRCDRLYWRGSHTESMQREIDAILREDRSSR